MLQTIQGYQPHKGPIVVIVMDGIGEGKEDESNAVHLAYTPMLDRLKREYPFRTLKAHGTAVGLPSDEDMGNSEVAHNAVGAGRVYSQGAKLVNEAIRSGAMFDDRGWTEIRQNCLDHESTLHFIGLFSDGNVHSNVNHLKAMIEQAKADGIRNVRVHILLDGRDVGETTALEYVEPFEAFLQSVSDDSFDAKIASGGGRMQITMDRYEADWDMVKSGWHTHVLGKGRAFGCAKEAILTYRSEEKVIDQDLPAFVIEKNGEPVGQILDGDSVVFFNFRGDRAIEITRAFEDAKFDKFDRIRYPNVVYAGMLQYDGDLNLPSRFLVSPPRISDTLSEYLAALKIRQFALSETQKFGHVTYFWNGNRSGKFDDALETYEEIPSDRLPFEQRPWMQCAKITDRLIEVIRSEEYDFIRINFPNGDMVGHTGNMAATRIGVEAVDLCLSRILPVIERMGGMAIITADHGNSDEMYEIDKKGDFVKNEDGSYKAKTSHTLNPVPCIFYDPNAKGRYSVKDGAFGLSNIAATIANLLGYEKAKPWDESMIHIV